MLLDFFISHESAEQQQQAASDAWFFMPSFIFMSHDSPQQQHPDPSA
jgi:hypothetical protein